MSDVKAVVVRLPLSGEQREKFLFCIDSGEPIDAETSALEAALLAIGTPVAGGELEYCAQIVWHDDAVEPEVAACRNKDIKKGDSIKVVRQSDAQSALAAAHAEIAEEQRISNLRAEVIDRWSNSCAHQDEIIAGLQVENMRLRDHLETVRSYIKEAPSVISRRGALDVIEEALKGPVA